MRGFSAGRYEALFDKDMAEAPESGAGQVGRLGHRSVLLYRAKRVVAGNYMEMMLYPVWDRQREATRAKKLKPTGAAQEAQNIKNSRRELTWMMNANFVHDDLFLTLTYKGEQPHTVKEAQRDIQAYIRRIRRWRDKRGMPELRYIYAIEYEADGRKTRIHHHIVMSGMDRDEAERIWARGRANSHRLQPDEQGLEGLAKYITKTQGHRAGEKRWCGSRNLEPYHITFADHKFSKRDIERMAGDEGELWNRLSRKVPGYQVSEITIKRSDYMPGAYITAKLRRIEPASRGKPGGMIEEAAKAFGAPRQRRSRWRRHRRPPPY